MTPVSDLAPARSSRSRREILSRPDAAGGDDIMSRRVQEGRQAVQIGPGAGPVTEMFRRHHCRQLQFCQGLSSPPTWRVGSSSPRRGDGQSFVPPADRFVVEPDGDAPRPSIRQPNGGGPDPRLRRLPTMTRDTPASSSMAADLSPRTPPPVCTTAPVLRAMATMSGGVDGAGPAGRHRDRRRGDARPPGPV